MTTIKEVVCKDLDSCQIVSGSTIRKIMIPFDNSSHATRAFSFAMTLAKIFGASLFVISIVKEQISQNWVNNTPTREKLITKDYGSLLKDKINLLKTQAKNLQINFDFAIITSNHIDEKILSIASEQKIDLIVMGTRGKGMPKEMMLGRVSTSVALNSICPVVLVK